MKRSQMYKKVNRKSIQNRLRNHVNRNIVYPTIFFNANIEEERLDNAVEIIELNSNDDSKNRQQNNTNHTWCNTNDKYPEQHEDYKVNRTARDKRRQNNENTKHDHLNDSRYNDQYVLKQFCTDFYGIDCYDEGERIQTDNNPHSDLFNIIDSHRTYDTSSESNLYDDIEVVECDNMVENDYWNSNKDCYDNRNNITYDVDEKRTIWIYALKNKRYLTEHDFELLNIPSKESTSTTDEELSNDSSTVRRIATPIPTYIPKMIFPLSPTLPTVTEVTELQASANSDVSTINEDNKTPFQKPSNGWFKNETTKTQNDVQNTDNIEINYENNRQALSSRERKLGQAEINEQNKVDAKKETLEYCEPTIIICDNELHSKLNTESFENEIDVLERVEDDQGLSINSEDQGSSDNRRDCASDESLCNLQKPRIKLRSEMKTLKKNITDPIEKLDGNWIGQSLPNDDKLLDVYDYNNMDTKVVEAKLASQRTGSQGTIEESAGDRLFVRNMSLLKPAEWTQYLPLTSSVPSLHLSISVDTDSNYEKESWFKRFLQFLYCCK